MQGDITEDGICDKVAAKCVEVYGSIDILVNCAGICKIDDVLDFGREDWDPMIAINLTGAFDLSHAVAKYMIQDKELNNIPVLNRENRLVGLLTNSILVSTLSRQYLPRHTGKEAAK